ncbi:KH domain-containing protein [Ditylenchus destructor]|nr:KH domain-containing protein [Ditylenchus destructor]
MNGIPNNATDMTSTAPLPQQHPTVESVFAVPNGIDLSNVLSSMDNGVNGGAGSGIVGGDGTFVLAPGAERQHLHHQMQYQHPPPGVFPPANGLLGQGPGVPIHQQPHMVAGPSGMAGKPPQQIMDGNKLVMDYSTDFPKLPDAPVAVAPTANAWSRRPAIKSTEVTEAFKLQANERASRKQFGNVSEEQQKCNQVAAACGTKIELCEAKDQSLTILITGKRQNVEEARARLIRELQTQANTEVSIPKEYHGHIIGKEGTRLRQLEKDYLCRIYMPGRDEKSDTIKIVGPNEYIGEAARRIKDIGDEMSKQGTEVLQISRDFYPWIRGPFNENLDRIISETNAKINIPPHSAKGETIVITGEREGVEQAAKEIRAIYESKKNAIKSLTCKVPKAQHRFIIGTKRSGIEEILRDTDVIVDVPVEDDESETITLRGQPAKLGDALSQVYAKASSIISMEIRYSEWMRRFLIGPKGATLQSLVPKQEKLKLEFEDGGLIYLEGPPEVVKAANAALSTEIARLTKELSSEVVKVAPNLHRHIIGRNGTLVNKLKDENDVQISIPNENSNSDEIKIEGKKDGVQKSVDAIKEIVKRLENEKSRDIVIEHRFHGQVIGKSGEHTQKWRKEFPTVSIAFPDATNKSDIVNLRGDKKEVDKLYTAMSKLVKDLQESNYQDTVSIFKEYYKHIIGKNGANINRIRDETQTRIELPAQGDGRITVIGKKENVDKAIAQLNKIQNELASIVTAELTIPNRIHTRLLSNGRRLIRDIEDEFGGVHILFPKEKGSDKVAIRGPKEDVAKAETALKEVAKHCEQTTEEVSIATKPEFVRFLIGRDGANVKKLREKYPTVRIVFPLETDQDHQILLIGKKDEVEAVKKIYEKQIAELNETVEISMDVDPKYHRHFITRSAEVLKEIQNQNGGCQISFPRQDSNDSKVTIKGSKSCVESAKARIDEIVGDLIAQVTVNVEIAEAHHRSLMPHLNELRSKYNVRIKVPDRGTTNENGTTVDGIGAADLVQITGRDTKCEDAKQALIALIPVTKTVSVPLEYHRSLIGRGGESIRTFMSNYAVRVKVPTENEQSEEIAVTGANENVDAAIANLTEQVAEFDRQADDRKLRSFKTQIDVPLKYHQRLIGPGGAKVKEMIARHEVQIHIPRSESGSETINVTGYEANCNACREEIEETVRRLESLISQEISLDVRFHPRVIGMRGKNLRKIEEEFGVEIRMPARNDPHPDVVVVSGQSEDAVYDCCDKLRVMEEDYISDMTDRGHFNTRREEPKVEQKAQPQVQITGAPWQLDSMEQFPAMGSSNAPAAQPAHGGTGVWGSRRW